MCAVCFLSLFHLHSTMYLFQLYSGTGYTDFIGIYIPLCIYFNCLISLLMKQEVKFTFHYVSISTREYDNGFLDNYHLHSTMYLFQLIVSNLYLLLLPYLHSTMYLFQRMHHAHYAMHHALFTFHYVSISTVLNALPISSTDKFTFHYVSISTLFFLPVYPIAHDLHSTMYLFQQLAYQFDSADSLRFTFHYVSISTLYALMNYARKHRDLHSTMYLFQQ
mgnify:CR=1 FL=1